RGRRGARGRRGPGTSTLVPHNAAGPPRARGRDGAHAVARHGRPAKTRRARRPILMQPQAPRRSLSARVFHLLLHVLPEDVREGNGAEIEALFADQAADAHARGPLYHAAFVAGAAWDLVRRAPYEHWRRRGRHRNEDSPMRSFLADLRFAVRSFGRQPGATALIVLTLTLGIAANTAVFAIVDGLFLRPFPFPEPGRLVYLNERAPSWNLELTGINYPDFHTWRERASTFESMAL